MLKLVSVPIAFAALAAAVPYAQEPAVTITTTTSSTASISSASIPGSSSGSAGPVTITMGGGADGSTTYVLHVPHQNTYFDLKSLNCATQSAGATATDSSLSGTSTATTTTSSSTASPPALSVRQAGDIPSSSTTTTTSGPAADKTATSTLSGSETAPTATCDTVAMKKWQETQTDCTMFDDDQNPFNLGKPKPATDGQPPALGADGKPIAPTFKDKPLRAVCCGPECQSKKPDTTMFPKSTVAPGNPTGTVGVTTTTTKSAPGVATTTTTSVANPAAST